MSIANTNPETGIRYGVINANNAPDLYEEIIQNGTNLSYEAYKKDAIAQIKSTIDEFAGFGVDTQKIAEDTFDALESDFEVDEQEYEYEDKDGNQFLLSYLGGSPIIYCVKTNKIAHARLCSPCVPNAGDLDNLTENGHECYGVPGQYVVEEQDAK